MERYAHAHCGLHRWGTLAFYPDLLSLQSPSKRVDIMYINRELVKTPLEASSIHRSVSRKTHPHVWVTKYDTRAIGKSNFLADLPFIQCDQPPNKVLTQREGLYYKARWRIWSPQYCACVRHFPLPIARMLQTTVYILKITCESGGLASG